MHVVIKRVLFHDQEKAPKDFKIILLVLVGNIFNIMILHFKSVHLSMSLHINNSRFS